MGNEGVTDGGGTFADGGPIRLPLSVVTLLGQAVFVVPIEVGSTRINALLDTGSAGLRLQPGAVPDSDFNCITDSSITESYGSGQSLTGYAALATVSFGGIATPAPIPVMYVDQVTCTAPSGRAGACPSPLLTPFITPAALSGVATPPYQAILGVGMRNGSLGMGNPIVQLGGEPAFVVQVSSGGGDAGTLLIGPASQLGSFATFPFPPRADFLPNGVPAYNDSTTLPASVEIPSAAATYSFTANITSDAPGTYVDLDTLDAGAQLPAGTAVQVTIGYPDASLAAYAFTATSADAGAPDEGASLRPAGSPSLTLGGVLFWRYDVLFDQANGLIGFAPKG